MPPMFDIKKIEVTDADLVKVEQHFGFPFNEGQKKVIRHWETADIQACPGSGKTTTLAAKLIILATKLPANFQQGICIITHTNIAVEEIKEKLGSYANFYFRYPNHFGTIQSFVDKYLAIPAYKNKYKHSPSIVDLETYDREIRKSTVLQFGALKILDFNDVFVGGLTFNRHNFQVSKSVNSTEQFAIAKFTAPVMEKLYSKVVSAKKAMLKEGYLTYDEAYTISFGYIRTYPELKSFFVKRFPIVFIDEMQDMEIHQSDIIGELFTHQNSIIQKIGDTNQSIYSHSNSDEKNEWKPKINQDLQLIESNRISDNIVQLIKPVCISPQATMKGWADSNPIKPAIIVYSDESISSVKDEFGKLVMQHKLSTKGKIKCIGSRIGDSRLNINSYWNDFNRKPKRSEFANLVSYIKDIGKQLTKSKNVKETNRAFLSLCCKCFRICKIKNPDSGFYFTPYSLIQYLLSIEENKKIEEINSKIAYWITQLLKSGNISDDVNLYISELIAFFGGALNTELTTFLTDTTISERENIPEARIYTYTESDNEVQMSFDTIHGVKGETHAATLYLETFSRVFDIGGKILNFIAADEKAKENLRKEAACRKQLPLAYVALSRAQYFFAIAVHKDRFTDEHKKYFEEKKHHWDCIFI